jgi:bacteriorhodopsin
MIYYTAYLSLLIQLLVGIIDFFGLQIKVPEEKRLFRELLMMELSVQIVEMIFYVWLVLNFANIPNITSNRYYDWIFTTPVMLITLMAFLDKDKYTGIVDYIKKNKSDIIKVIGANMVMLSFGLMGELGYLEYQQAIILGFVPFLYYYNLIYQKYIKDKDPTLERKILFWFFFVIWTLYGVAALMPYEIKNILYNILDLFAKNLTGLFLVYILWSFRVKDEKKEELEDNDSYNKDSYDKDLYEIL